MMQQPSQLVPVTGDAAGGSSGGGADAPPKQVAQAMDRLSGAARLIADIRLGADYLLETLFMAAEAPRQQAGQAVQLILKEESAMRQRFQDLRALGRQLEESGVLSGSLKSRGNSWGLHMPLVCPDGAVVAYAWKRQLAGQAGASAVDRTRLALKAFSDQKRRFFPHLEDESFDTSCDMDVVGVAKKSSDSQQLSIYNVDEHQGSLTLSDVLVNLENATPNMKILTYQHLDWLKRASSLSSSVNESSRDHLPKEQNFSIQSQLRSGSLNVASADLVAIIEFVVPSVFRAVVSLHPAGSTNPDAVAFFSPDEGGNHVNARGSSVYHVFKVVTDHATKALQYFTSVDPDSSLSLLVHWIYNYQTLFSKVCSKCGRLLLLDKLLDLLLPPIYRPYQQTSYSPTTNCDPSHPAASTEGRSAAESAAAYHIGCSVDGMW